MANELRVLEVCVDSVESAIAAERGGADRLELCADLLIGGTTPTPPLFEAVRNAVSVPVHVMIRPRFGDFCYAPSEQAVMEAEAGLFSSLHADGLVFGALTPDGDLDLPFLHRMRQAVGDAHCTLHRCFDVCRDPLQALEEAIGLQMHTLLTSGQAACCMDGLPLLKELQEKANGRIAVMAGAGLTASGLPLLHRKTGITVFHMSGKKTKPSAMRFRREGVPMGLPGLSEYTQQVCDEEMIRAACAALHAL